MSANQPSEVYETDDKNLAALLRALGLTQTGKRTVPTADPDRPHYIFQFGDAKMARLIEEDAMIGKVEVNYQRFVSEQNAVMDQIFQHKRRNSGTLPGFLENRRPRR